MLLTERERRAIVDIEAVIREYAPVLMGKLAAAGKSRLVLQDRRRSQV